MPPTTVGCKCAEIRREGPHKTESPFRAPRVNPRLPFTAAVTALEPASLTEIEAHTTDLSVGGCYVDTMSPFPAETEVHLRLTNNGKSFHTKARVVYSQPGVGMGLLFSDIAPAQRSVLKRWLSDLRGESLPELPIVENDARAHGGLVSENDERNATGDLVVLLTQKHVLTEDEGETILRRLR